MLLRHRRTNERLMALLLLGILVFTPPLLVVFNTPSRVLGLPLLYLYLFSAWAVLIALVALAIERADAAEARAEAGHVEPIQAAGRGAGEATDA